MSSTRPAASSHTSLTEVVRWLRDAGHVVELVEPTVTRGTAEVHVSGASLSSQRVRPGDLYAALPGARAHGAAYVADAVAAGAAAVLTDPAGRDRCAAGTGVAVPLLVVEAPREVLGLLSARLHGDPAAAMAMIGVTGTQGKTTTTRLAEAGLLHAGVSAAVIGTVGTRIAGTDVPTSLTTPEAPDLHGLFAVMRERGVEGCVMEVSSHALVLGRVDGVVFDVAVFLNLGRDHLDFHADLEEYYQAKASLFTPAHARLALVNVDDEHGRRLVGDAGARGLPVRTFSSKGHAADWSAHDVRTADSGSSFLLRGPGMADREVTVPLPGAFNVENALAALAACGEAGFAVGHVADGLAAAHVPGRMQRVERGQDFTVVVDYAHKPDALEAAVTALRPVAAARGGRVVVVVGAGGDRDRGKRPLMGEVTARLADVVVVTDDNPRTEDPATIRAAVLAGARGVGAEVLEIGDRREAISHAVAMAQPGDVVLVAGKGHETGQEIDGVTYPFDDLQVAETALDRVVGGRS